MRVQTQNHKKQESTIFFKRAKQQSVISKCHLSATKSFVWTKAFKKKKKLIKV